MYGDLTFTHGLTTDDKGLHNTDPSSNRCSLYISDIEWPNKASFIAM